MSSDRGALHNEVSPEIAVAYRAAGWWGDDTVADLVKRHASSRPNDPAIVTMDNRLTWREYDNCSDRLGRALVQAGLEPGERVAVVLPDGGSVHVAFLANEKAGTVTVGIGARAGDRELKHLMARTGSVALVSHAEHRGADMPGLFERLRADGLPLRQHVIVPNFESDAKAPILVDGNDATTSSNSDGAPFDGRRLGPDDLFMINSTSGTTGLPKCVMHTQNSKFYMAKQACAAAHLGGDEIIAGMAPVPFGFGLFTTHFLPALLGAPAVVTDRFTAASAIDLIAREHATVLVCVSTQFKMMLNDPEMATRDLSSLRVMFTGGEMIPYEAARQFEERTGSLVLNFYGSNESGFATGTKVTDSTEHRLRSAGRRVPGTEVRLFEGEADVTNSGRGQPGSRGPATCLGYFDDAPGNAELFTSDGFVLHADIATIDEKGYLTVVGRKSEIIIRGGKNISAAGVEDAVSGHPSVALASAVPMPDPVFGERVCAYVELRPGTSLTLPELVEYLEQIGVSKENFPEHLVVMEQIPRSSGGKVAKGELATDARIRAAGRQEGVAR